MINSTQNTIKWPYWALFGAMNYIYLSPQGEINASK